MSEKHELIRKMLQMQKDFIAQEQQAQGIEFDQRGFRIN